MYSEMRSIWERIRADIIGYRYAALALVCYEILARRLFHAFCPMVILTGLPCPGCGMSRALYCLLTGQTARSLSLHPLAGFWLLWFIWFCVERYGRGKAPDRLMVGILVLLSAATLVLYVWRMAAVFPDRPPMSYTGHNLMEKCIPDYRRRILTYFRLYR
jgi:hypothetical protein